MPKRDGSELETYDDWHFPKGGIDRASAYGRQPTRKDRNGVYVRTAFAGENIRGFDPLTLRDRGGSRPGLSKFISTQVNGLFITQHLNSLTTTAQSGATLQTSLSGRVVTLVAVSQGVVKTANPDSTVWVTPTNNTGSTPALNFTGLIYSAQNNQKLYFVDGTNYAYYSPALGTVEAWTATAGALPTDTGVAPNNKGRLICTWRGRTVISGLLKDPQNWFMSKVSDPHDFDYGATPAGDPTNAVFGNNAGLGLIGDVVTALVPYTDDVLVFGGDHTIYMMRGDPLAGGQIDLISDSIGMAYGLPWAKDPYGNIYFFSNKCGIYRFIPGQQAPIRISQAIESYIQDVNTGTHAVTMIWNDRFQGLHVFVTALAAPAAATHYFWEMRTNAWWTDVFANTNHNPLCCVAFDGNDPDDRRLLIGSWDGYVRELDPDATTDDATNITSFVWLGPILTQQQDLMILKDMQAMLALGSGDITYAVHVGDTAELALAATATVTGTWSASRNTGSPVRRSGHAIYVKLSSTSRWALESIRARFVGRGKVARRS